MTPYLEKIPIGDEVKMTGPKGNFYYMGDSHFVYKDKVTG